MRNYLRRSYPEWHPRAEIRKGIMVSFTLLRGGKRDQIFTDDQMPSDSTHQNWHLSSEHASIKDSRLGRLSSKDLDFLAIVSEKEWRKAPV